MNVTSISLEIKKGNISSKSDITFGISDTSIEFKLSDIIGIFFRQASLKIDGHTGVASNSGKSTDTKSRLYNYLMAYEANISTQDVSRDGKIVEFFFKTMATDELKGHIVKLTDDGVAELEVTMNGITDIVTGKYTLEGAHFAFNATMDIAKWSAQKAIDVLNENCKANHTENGVTKVWTEVDLSFTTHLTESK